MKSWVFPIAACLALLGASVGAQTPPTDAVTPPAEAPPRNADAGGYTARLTIDVTPELRGRIKIAAFRRSVTVADMLRDLLAREFPPTEGDPS